MNELSKLNREQLEKIIGILTDIVLDNMDADLVQFLLSRNGVTDDEKDAMGF